MADRKLLFDIFARDRNTRRTLEGIADSADDAGKSFDDLGKDTKQLDRHIGETEKHLRSLIVEFDRTGDVDLFKKIRSDKSRLNLLQSMRKIGGDGAEEFSVGFASRVGPLLAKAPISPPIVAAVLGAGTVAAPALGALLSAGVIGGLSGGAVLAGVKLALRDPRVRGEADDLGRYVSLTLGEAAQSFGPATVGAIGVVRGELGKMKPELREIFDIASTFTVPLTRGITGLVRNALPGVVHGLEKAAPVVATLEVGFKRMGSTIGDAIGIIGSGSTGAAQSLADLFLVTDAGIRVLALNIRTLTASYEGLRRLSAATGGIGAALPEPPKGAMADFAAELAKLKENFKGVDSASTGAADALKNYRTAVDEAFGKTMSLDEATLAYERTLDDTAETLREGRKTLDTNTAAGRDNKSAILDRVKAIGDMRSAEIAAGGSVSDANTKYQAHLETLRANLLALGFNKTAVNALIEKYKGIPRNVGTNVKANTKPALSAIAKVKADIIALGRLHPKVHATVFWTSKGLHVPGGTILEHAKGGPVQGPGPKGVDSVPMLAAPGEHVLTAREVDAAGGHRAIEAWRKSLVRGSAPAMAAGTATAGGGGVTNHYHVTVAGGVIGSRRELENWFTETMDRLHRKGRL